jgi:hypothetical protein
MFTKWDLNNLMNESPSESNSSSSSQEILSILCNMMIHYRVHKSQSLVLILSQMNPVHTTLSYVSKIPLNIILSSIPSAS